jgi:hypothetical protein
MNFNITVRSVPRDDVIPPASAVAEQMFLARLRRERSIPLDSLGREEYAAACQLTQKSLAEMVGDASLEPCVRLAQRT